MAILPLTDDLGKSAPDVRIDLSHPSSLIEYAKGKVAHFIVVPDFIGRAAQLLHLAAPNPISFDLKLNQKIPVADAAPEIDLVPGVEASIRANTTAGANLLKDDPFHAPAAIPPQAGYVGLTLQGSLDLSVSGSAGNATYGFDLTRGAGLQYWKAFPLGAGEPTFGAAAGATLSGCFIPWTVDDLAGLAVNDICSVSGSGSLKLSGGFSVSAAPNPLASLDLPLNAGQVQVKAGALAGIKASFTVEGDYQVRLRRISADAVELGVYRKDGATLTAALSASAGVSVVAAGSDVLKSLLGAISADPTGDDEKKLLGDGGLAAPQIAALAAAIQGGLDSSLQVSLNAALSELSSEEAAFQYELRPGAMDAASRAAVQRALGGDFSALPLADAGGAPAPIAPGVRLTSSVLTDSRKLQATLHINLFGLVNVLSVSELLLKSVVVDDRSGAVTLADSATANRIAAVVEPMRRQAALRQAMFESLLLTAAYRVSSTVQMAGLSSQNFHFAADADAGPALAATWLQWFVALGLLTPAEREAQLAAFPGGSATCLLRTVFDDAASQRLFFSAPGRLRDPQDYLDIGRQALRSVLDREGDNLYRYRLLDQQWQEAFREGPVGRNLAGLAGVDPGNAAAGRITDLLVVDIASIAWWAGAMRKAGEALLEMRQFLAAVPAGSQPDRDQFAARRGKLQKALAGVVHNSQPQLTEPWGLIALEWAAGSPPASALLAAGKFTLRKPSTAAPKEIAHA